ncbi:hypothetical protein [Streptomyces sp. YIM S03343]
MSRMSRRRLPEARAVVEAAVNAKAAPVVAQLLVLAGLLTAAACSGVGLGSVTAQDPRDTELPPTAAPAGTTTLTAAQASAATITDADLGAPWTPTQGAATWRDGLLKATVSGASPDCQRLLDALYADEILGAPSSPQAVVALDDPGGQAQLRYQVSAHRAADVDRTLGWLRTLPQTCGRFSAATTRAGVQDVQVAEEQLPQVGDARQGLRVTLTAVGGEAGPGGAAGPSGEDDGSGSTGTGVLTLDIAAVRVGDDAITVTTGGTGAVSPTATQLALQLGTQRLTEVRRQHSA